MDKMKFETVDGVERNVDRIAALFPQVVTEIKGEDGKINRAVKWDVLKELLSGEYVEGGECYDFTWPGKRAAIAEAARPIRKTLRPCVEEGKDWDTTQNLYIEGDNLEVLKLLQESYLGKVKMIYIDPPYNTGNDFIYEDDFKMSRKQWADESESAGEDEETGETIRMFKNTESNGRFHSDWCSMIFSRLVLARDLLSEDGVIFISIDDNEVENLKKICDEVFGEENFLTQIIWKKRSTPPNDKVIGTQHDYIVCYARSLMQVKLFYRERTSEQIARYSNPDNHPKGPWMSGDLMANIKGGRYVASLYFPIINPRTKQEHYPSSNGNWRFNKETIEKLIQNDEIYFGEDDHGRPKLKRFLCDVKEGVTWTTLWDFPPFNTAASKEMASILGNMSIFENPKPTGLIIEILKLAVAKDSLVLDFFSGSATTAHAIMQLNSEDGGKRKFIMVQLPEECAPDSEAAKAGYKNICEIGKERIRRAGEKIKEEAGLAAADLDIGFRVFKVADGNMKDVYYSAPEYSQGMLGGLVDNIKDDRTDLDLLYGCLLEWGVELSLPHTSETIDGVTVHTVNGGDLIACFAPNIPESAIRTIAKRQPLRVVFRDSSFAGAPQKINVEEIFKILSPTTTVKVI